MQNLEIDKEYTIERGRKKWYDFNNAQNVTLRFNPRSKSWFLLQKMLDAIILGLVAVMIYELFPRSKINTEKLNYLLKNPSAIKGVGKKTIEKIKKFLDYK